MSVPPVTVLMPVYNAAEFLALAMDSILGQTFRDFRCLVVDDGSTDCSPAILTRYAEADRRVSVLTKTHGGITAALNAGLRHIDSTYIARMDADDVAVPLRFERQIARIDKQPILAALGTRVRCIDREGRPGRLRPVVTTPDAVAAILPYRNAVSHPSAMIRTDVLKRVGGYREKLKLSQDYDLWLRLSEAAQVDNLEETLLFYRVHSGRATATSPRGQTVYSVAAAADFFARRYGLPTDDAAIDVAEPTSVTSILAELFAGDIAPADREALYRHAMRLIRYAPSHATATLSKRLRQELAGGGKYGLLAKLALYAALRRKEQA